MAPSSTSADYDRLKAFFAPLPNVLVAFSGGVDSSLVLAAAVDGLGERALAVTAASAIHPEEERVAAEALVRLLGARHRIIETRELADPVFLANSPERCYRCKQGLLGELTAIARHEGIGVIVDGSNRDDDADFRPGSRAKAEAGVRSPLAELGFDKATVRRLAQWRGLPAWDRPAAACLASRLPYGEAITREKLTRIERAEAAVRVLGFRVVRVRDHGASARLEIGPDELERALEVTMRGRLAAALKQAGYTFASLDLEGYRTGSLNETLG